MSHRNDLNSWVGTVYFIIYFTKITERDFKMVEPESLVSKERYCNCCVQFTTYVYTDGNLNNRVRESRRHRWDPDIVKSG